MFQLSLGFLLSDHVGWKRFRYILFMQNSDAEQFAISVRSCHG
jgi:hypothetical protein